MRTAIVNWTGRRAGGVETYLGLLIPALQRFGHEVFFWYEQNAPADRELIAALGDVPSSCASDRGFDEASASLVRWRPDVLFVHSLLNPDREHMLLSLAPGVFFAHAYYGTCISGHKTVRWPVLHPCDRRFGPACLAHYFPRRCGGLSPLTMVREYRRQSQRLDLLRRYHGIVTFSEHMRREYLRHEFPADRVHRLPAVDPLHTAPAAAARDTTVGDVGENHDRTWRLTFMGRVDRLKGCHVLLEALETVRARLPGPIVLTVAGDGPDLARCRAIARSLVGRLRDLDVLFLGWIPQNQCLELLDGSDVVVMPSLWPEPFGLAGLEAQRRGVPVAAFGVGGIPEWLENGGTGAIAPAAPPTADGLAEAIVRCLTSPEIRRNAAAQARRQRDEYSVERHVESLVPLLASAAGAPVALEDATTSTR